MAQISLDDFTHPEQKCISAIKRLQEKNPKYFVIEPPSSEVAEEAGYSQSRASQIIQMLRAKGAFKQSFQVVV